MVSAPYPSPQCPNCSYKNFGNSAVKGYIAYCALRMRDTAIFLLPV